MREETQRDPVVEARRVRRGRRGHLKKLHSLSSAMSRHSSIVVGQSGQLPWQLLPHHELLFEHTLQARNAKVEVIQKASGCFLAERRVCAKAEQS